VNRLRVAVICDFAEEGWPSMDLVGEMLCAQLESRHAETLSVTRIRPPFACRLSRGNAAARGAHARFSADRALNRFFDYPRLIRRMRGGFDVFHVVDHSYAHLVHELAAPRTIVTCHDLDAFDCLLGKDGKRRSPVFRAMARRILSGMRKAARVGCDTVATRDALAANGLVSPARLVVIPNGVHPACSPTPDEAADTDVARLLGADAGIELLHVGSAIARKRIDILLRVFAAAHREFPALRLVKAGGTFTGEQQKLARSLGVTDAIVTVPYLAPEQLAALYRRAAMVLLPADAEGFGLPLAEALACGTPVLASDIAALREVGADAVSYCPVGDVSAWSASLLAMLHERAGEPARWAERRAWGVRRAARFSWAQYADRCAALYCELANDGGSTA
jgi:glycosyltransferase involved in cell wall biosynthesis